MLCIYCDNNNCKDFFSYNAVLHHMADRGHTKMNMDNMAQFDNYFDY